MSVRNHRIAAVVFLITGTLAVAAWGRSQANEPAPNRAVREQLRGEWVATSIQAGDKLMRAGADVSATRVTFEGKEVVFRALIEGDDAQGTYFVDPATSPPKIDFKLDAGWVIGVYELGEDSLILNIVPLALAERLGVPSRYRAPGVAADKHHQRYVFRRATPRDGTSTGGR